MDKHSVEKDRRITAIVCAAGLSTRMGNKNKLLLPFSGAKIISHVVKELMSSRIDRLVVVLGSDAQGVQDAVEKDSRINTRDLLFVFNEDFEQGHTSSIQAGISGISWPFDDILIGLGDMPLISTQLYNDVIEWHLSCAKNKAPCISRPVVNTTPGHPVLIDEMFVADLLRCPIHQSCIKVIMKNRDHFHPMKSQDESYIRDIDTKADYDRLLSEISS